MQATPIKTLVRVYTVRCTKDGAPIMTTLAPHSTEYVPGKFPDAAAQDVRSMMRQQSKKIIALSHTVEKHIAVYIEA